MSFSRLTFGLGAIVAVLLVAACAAEEEVGAVPNPNGKAAGAVCKQNSECQSLSCKAGKCTAPTGGNPMDNKRNGDETDVDCGGSIAPKCAELKSCKIADDCASGICTGAKCAAPSPDDGVKNGDETDVDCGGSKAPKCAADKGCEKNADCATDACSYAKKCVEFRSCTGHFGGDTCGAGETGTGEAKHESCCTTVTNDEGTRIGKYLVTAGRMRAFVERYNGNLQGWAKTAKGWNASWTQELPASMDDALVALGPMNKRSCRVAFVGGRTFWQPPIDGDSEEVSDWSKDVLDEKALNCVSWYMAQAICHFDGGRLATHDEIFDQVTNGGSTMHPWGNSPRFVKGRGMDEIIHAHTYFTPNPPASLRLERDRDGKEFPLDVAMHIAPPGRRPSGANKLGVQDAMGNMLPWVHDGPRRFAWTASWENHEVKREVGTWPPSSSPNPAAERDGYYAIGARCAFPKQ